MSKAIDDLKHDHEAIPSAIRILDSTPVAITHGKEQDMATLHHQVWINSPVSKVYEGLATAEGLGQWWAPHTSTKTADGLVLAHGAGSEHGEVQMKVLQTIRDKRIEWEIVSTHPRRSPASAWTGTHLLFEITERENPGHWLGISDGGPRLAVLEFRHSGWNEDSEYFGFCNFAWGETLLMLKQWCESRNA